MSLADWKTVTEVAANVVTVLAIPGGLWAWWRWLAERHDRSTEVLFKLEERFESADNRKARKLLENGALYRTIRVRLIEAVLFAGVAREAVPASTSAARRAPASEGENILRDLELVDCFLRFYVFLCGIRAAKQVPDNSLRICYRYWLAHYYHPGRIELHVYINEYFPTLRRWLKEDREKHSKKPEQSFFNPKQFGWKSEPGPQKPLREAARGRVLVLTGSGISAESGIPTFRGQGGYWRDKNPQKLATRKAFHENAPLVWEWYEERRKRIREAHPNAAHHALLRLATEAKDFLVVTQNVDDLHERAGTADKLVHIHGKIFDERCMKCNQHRVAPLKPDTSHTCPECDGLLRPSVVWFDEDLDTAEERRVESFLEQGPCDLVLVIGTTGTFSYVADWAVRGAGSTGWLIEINPEETPFTPFANGVVRRKAAEFLPRLLKYRMGIEMGKVTAPASAQARN